MTTVSDGEESRAGVQRRLLLTLLAEVGRGQRASPSTTDVEVHRQALEAMRSILEQCGEALLSGWDLVFEIMTSAFAKPAGAPHARTDERSSLAMSPRLVRSAVGSLQLICSDFLPSLPRSCVLILIDTLFLFCVQDDDLNISLTVS